MTAVKLDGKEVARQMRQEIARAVAARGGAPPGLAAVIVGENPASQTYVRHKRKACDEVGIANWLHTLPATATEGQLLGLVAALNADARVHGILVQLPLPAHIREEAVIRAIAPLKDVDCFHPENLGLLVAGHPRYSPCTPRGVIELVERSGIAWAGKRVVVVGRSNIVGKPLALLLMQKRTAANPAGGDATVTVAHTRTPNLAEVCRTAEILVAAAGVPNLITADMVAPGAVVVDVGTNAVDGKLVGDVAADVADVAGFLSPVPGGVGPMTITLLLANALAAAQLLEGQEPRR